MKKFYLSILIIACAVFNNCKAQQYVTIPDPVFAGWLQTHGYAGCMNGDQLDTTCSAVLNASVMNCYGIPIHDLTGVQYFKNLDSLDCSHDSLTFIPSFPPNLSYINCEHNQLHSLPELPSSLTYLDCGGNRLSYLPALPASLTQLVCAENQLLSLPGLPTLSDLDCTNNQLHSLPLLPPTLLTLWCGYNYIISLPQLPDSLYLLVCENNQLSSLPSLPAALYGLNCSFNLLSGLPVLPNSLQTLACDDNSQLTSLPVLPSALGNLYCDYCQLSTLPTLPPNLTSLYCAVNPLTSLPALPGTLQYLVCFNCQLSNLPALPASLTDLECDHNLLTSLPTLPDMLDVFNCNDNPNLICLPELKRIVSMNFGNTAITCLPDYGNITNSTPPLHSLPLCGIYNPTGCQTFWNISGQSYYDQNNNCSFDNVDAGTNYVKTQLYSGGNLQQQVYSGSEGFYSFNAVSYGNYTVQVDTTNLPFIVSCPGSGYHAVTLSASDSLSYSNNFAFKCRTEGFDIGVHSVLNNYAVPRPNATITLNTIAGDISELYGAHCATGISGQVQITYTGELTYTGPAPGALTPDNVTGNTITWNIADFGTVNIFTAFNLMFHVNMFATPGTQACFTVSVTPTNGDYNPDNNTSSYCLTIVNSLDPNEKEVSPTGNVQSADEWLTYTIRFQNTGSAPALNVRITDTLDSNLDPSTFELLAYSAANLTQIFGNDVVFNFPNINLPDSATSDSASRGYVQYKIKLRDNLGTTAQIQNTANIYFDFNEPIVTNTTQNTFCNTIYTDTFITTTCGQLIFFNNYFFSLPGLYYDSIPGQSGCDSIITTLHLTVVNDTINQFAGLCTGDSISFYGTYIHATGVYNTILPSQNLCDTIVTLSVVVHAPIPPTYLYDTLCDGDSIAFDGAYIYTSGTYTAHFNSQHGCDSSVVLNLTVLPPAQPTNIYNTICTGDSLFFGGSFIKTTGTYTSHLNTQYGCDSAVVLNLSVLSQAPTTYIYDTICTGDIINFNGNFIYATGIYTAHYSPEGVCDSTVILSLTVMAPVPVTYIYDTICQGYSLPFNGGFADTAGTYTAHYNTPYGCDSIVVLQLHTTITANLVLSANLCSHDSLYFYGTYLHQPGIYLDTVPATGTGCDTLVSLHIFPLSLTASVYDTICEGDSIEFNGSIYNTSGTHTATLLTEGGCDSSVTLFITVIPTPVVTFTWDSLIATQDVYSIYGYHDTAFWCVDIFPYKFRLTGGSPPGGYYTGAGVSGDSINLFPVYNFGFYFTDTITYTYADGPGCAQSVSKILAYSPCEGINEVNANTLFTLYPNPAKDYVTIETDLSAIGGTLQITDVTGRTVDRLQVTGSKLQVNTNQFSAGVYFVKLSDKQGRNATVKLVIQ